MEKQTTLPFNERFALALCASLIEEHAGSQGGKMWISRSCSLARAAYSDMRPIEVGSSGESLGARLCLADLIQQAKSQEDPRLKTEWLRCLPGFPSRYFDHDSTLSFKEINENVLDVHGYVQMVITKDLLSRTEKAVRRFEPYFAQVQLSFFDQSHSELEKRWVAQSIRQELDAATGPAMVDVDVAPRPRI